MCKYICVNVYMLLCVTKINVFLTVFAMDEMIKSSCSVQVFSGRNGGGASSSGESAGTLQHQADLSLLWKWLTRLAHTTHHVSVTCL